MKEPDAQLIERPQKERVRMMTSETEPKLEEIKKSENNNSL